MKFIETIRALAQRANAIVELVNRFAKYIPLVIDLLENIIKDFSDDGKLNGSATNEADR